MFGPELLLGDRQRAAVETDGARKVSARAQQKCEIDRLLCYFRVIRSQRFLEDSQGPADSAFRRIEPALAPVGGSQSAERLGDVGRELLTSREQVRSLASQRPIFMDG